MIAAIGPELEYVAADLNGHTQPGRPAWLFFRACLIVSGPLLPGIRFLMRCVRAQITDSAFDRWLGQDALFVGDLLTFQARLLARAPRPAQAVLAGGRVALVAELDWFEVQAARRGIELGQPALPATLAYGELLRAGCRALRGGGDGAVGPRTGVSARVGLRRVEYLPVRGVRGAWTAPGFAGYVDALGELAILDGHDELVGDVLSHEVAFWDMAVV